MLLHVIGSVELLQASVTVERLLLLVNILVPREQVSTVGHVRADGAVVALLNLHILTFYVGTIRAIVVGG